MALKPFDNAHIALKLQNQTRPSPPACIGTKTRSRGYSLFDADCGLERRRSVQAKPHVWWTAPLNRNVIVEHEMSQHEFQLAGSKKAARAGVTTVAKGEVVGASASKGLGGPLDVLYFLVAAMLGEAEGFELVRVRVHVTVLQN